MVTYIDTKNREKYQVLFNKAEQTLRDAAEHNNLPEGIDINTLEIITLNQYFAYLQDLISLASNENIKSYFLRLPLDEELFVIDANTRNIKIPTNFSRNGVGVQGDETAEIVYFSIDRYFDHMDLASEDMNIVIQWEAKDKNRQVITGISPNFGKDIETIPGKIIFGWPIYSELTQAAGTIKFAVRFFSLGAANSEGIRALNYSLATLPAEISVGATINYDLINKTVMEVDRGKMILNRVKNVGVYDPSVPVPAPAVITTPLYVVGADNEVLIVDLPSEPGQGITLRVSAEPGDFGAVQYDWRKYSYDSASGGYFNTSDSIDSSSVTTEYEEVTTNLTDDLYYQITSDPSAAILTYAPVDIDTFLATEHPYIEDHGFAKADGGYVKLYKKYSTATVSTPGIYTVDIGVRNGVNTYMSTMPISDGVKIPGPEKPVINDPTPTANISVTADHVAHVIVDDSGIVTLPTSAVAGEIGKSEDEVGHNPIVSLSYDWKRFISGTAQSVDGESVAADPMQVYILGTSGHGFVPEDDNEEDAAYNQSKLTLNQVGNQIIIYATDELRTYTSTNPEQGDGKWIGLDIDTGLDTIEGAMWSSYEMTSGDVHEAASVGLGEGHIIFWAKAEDLVSGREIRINDHPLTIAFSSTIPSNLSYSFNSDKSEVTISGLIDKNLDELYYVDITAQRNGIRTTERSGDYRLTKAPTKPVLTRRVLNEAGNRLIQKVSDYKIEATAIDTPKLTKRGEYSGINFSVQPIAHSDALSYVWMRMNVEDIDEDRNLDNSIRLQVDLDNLLPDLFADIEGSSQDIPVDGVFGLTSLSALGEVIDDADNMPEFKFNENTPDGYYYCIVINELNNHRVANVTPFYYVHG